MGLIKDFIEHLFPKKIRRDNLKITYTLCLGGLCFLCFFVLLISGILLTFYYEPGDRGYNSILLLESSVFGGIFLRSIHRYASDSLLIFLILHIIRVIFQGAYLPPRSTNWLIGCVLFLLCFFEAYLGYVLVQDQVSIWALKTGMELLNFTFLTRIIYNLIVVDGVFGELTFTRIYILHIIIIPFLILILCSMHIYKIRKQKGILPYI